MMEVTQETRDNWRVVTVRGRADSETADTLETELRTAVEQHQKVAVDFHAVDYISSAGLRAVIQAARAAEGKRGEFAVCSLSAPVKKVFDMSGMRHIITIHGDLPC
jgi:anti-sigma B factor antagonist